MKSLRISEIVNGIEKWILLVHEGETMYSKISKAIEEELFKPQLEESQKEFSYEKEYKKEDKP